MLQRLTVVGQGLQLGIGAERLFDRLIERRRSSDDNRGGRKDD